MASVAQTLERTVAAMIGSTVPIEFWDGSVLGPPSQARFVVNSPAALRRLLWAPGELGLARAYVAGEIDIQGDVFEALALFDRHETETRLSPGGVFGLIRAGLRAGFLGMPMLPPPEEARLRGRVHSRARDATAISHHYDVGNDFYRLVLGPTMTYSCAYFEMPGMGLDEAQMSKYELVCRKLGVGPDTRLLDIGCGWGGLVMHAARVHGARALGVTLSREQAEYAQKEIAGEGLVDRVEVRIQDYRDVDDGPFDAIASVGMFEHVGSSQVETYVGNLLRLLRPGGRLLNHAISRPRGVGAIPARSFVGRYVFPDGELHEVGRVVTALQEGGLEVRDVESLREHYAATLRCWVRNLERRWDEAVGLVGEGRARVWRLYMAGSALNFAANRNSIHQVLAVRPDESGNAGFPRSRNW